jgi:acetyl esterase
LIDTDGTDAGQAVGFAPVLDPEIQQIVELMEAASGPPAHLVPIDQARIAHDREGAIRGGPGEEVAEVREITVPGPGGPIPVRVFRPAGEGPLALVAYAHGGGWVLGSLDGFDPVCLATVTARHLRDEGGSPLRFQALVYPVCDSALDTPSYRACAEGFGLSAVNMKRYWDLYLDGADGRVPDASPLQADDLSGLPPAFVLTVRDDVLRDEGEAYAHALEAGGVPVTLRRYDGAVHGFIRWLAKSRLSRQAVADVGAALREGLA